MKSYQKWFVVLLSLSLSFFFSRSYLCSIFLSFCSIFELWAHPLPTYTCMYRYVRTVLVMAWLDENHIDGRVALQVLHQCISFLFDLAILSTMPFLSFHLMHFCSRALTLFSFPSSVAPFNYIYQFSFFFFSSNKQRAQEYSAQRKASRYNLDNNSSSQTSASKNHRVPRSQPPSLLARSSTESIESMPSMRSSHVSLESQANAPSQPEGGGEASSQVNAPRDFEENDLPEV